MVEKQTEHNRSQRAAVEEAHCELRCLRIPWYEVEHAAVEVARAHPDAEGAELVTLIVNATVDHWSTGMGY
jgi:hypothetical protein